jgi:C-terminal processing protease CtpA/Prc
MLIFVTGVSVLAQDMPDAEIENDEGGVQRIEGELSYTDPTLGTYGSQPQVVLGSLDPLLDPDFVYYYATEWLATDQPQYSGIITSPVSESPFTYELYLPIAPENRFVDVDNNGSDDTGVMIFNVVFTFDGFGSTQIERYDFSYYESTITGDQLDNSLELIGGTMLVYSPDDQQGFPSGYGEDGQIFTEDDPIVRLPAGWTVVNLDDDPFTFDRSQVATVDIIEPEGEASPDFSDLSYTAAFDAMIELMRRDYAFTEFKNVDWNALVETYRPLFEEAEANNDAEAYQLALNQFVEEAIPDGHIGIGSDFLFSQGLPANIMGGLGLAIVELSDGRFIANYVGEETPASDEGIELGAEILSVNGVPVGEAIEELPGLNPPYSSDTLRRLEQIRQVMRFSVGDEVEIEYQNPGDSEPTSANLTAIEESDSRIFSRGTIYGEPRSSVLPIEFEILPSGYGYISIYSFFDSHQLASELWRAAIRTANDFGLPGLIIDMRYNGGGSTAQYVPMAGSFFDTEQVIGNTGQFAADIGDFYFDERMAERIIPLTETDRYAGEVALIVGPSCFSACEFFSQMMTTDDRAAVVGHYPTGGLGGSIAYFFMPEGVQMQFTEGRAVNADGDIHIEGSGVEPTITVPVTEETVFSEGDPLLDAAVAWLDETTAPPVSDGGVISVGDTVTGELALGERVFYTLVVQDDATLTITLGDETGEFDTVLTVLDIDGNVIAENDDSPAGDTLNSLIEGLEVSAGETLMIQVGTYADSGEGAYQLTVEES